MTSILTLITPTNLESEKENFLQSQSYNPIFNYLWQDISFPEPIINDPIKHILWESIRSQNSSQITEYASKYFEVRINPTYLDRARKEASTKGHISHGSAQEYARLTRQALAEFGLEEVAVVVTDQGGFNARPQHKDNRILVSSHIQFEYFSMEGGVRHELVHVLRYHNGKHNQIKRSNNYLPTEEGLASWCQDNTNDDNGLSQHAMEYVASSVGLKSSLRDVYNCLRDLGMSSELAWKRASRHKFGFVDTSLPGDIMKPAMYYANEIKVAELSTDEKIRLFVGKISLKDLPDHPTYSGLWPSNQLISYFKL